MQAQPALTEGKKCFIQFVESYLQISFQGVQPGYGYGPDYILFEGPRTALGCSTLAVPWSVLLCSTREEALDVVRAKVEASVKAFAAGTH